MPSMNQKTTTNMKLRNDGDARFASTYTQQHEGVYGYDNTMKAMLTTQNSKSNGVTFKSPSLKSPSTAGSRTFI